ncbi:hypothetical protein [Streptomyces sp. I05A-00742]|uniref:hypothetical protein n=1 Tax=Streptomyces sp. I05A-00742 TaxID=2732853 RepID=UPI001487B223|nr:hypothetical protein [Streptomyces sp. I05A-00742]
MAASRAALGRDDLRTKVAVQRVRLGAEEYRVIRPARGLKNAALYAVHNDGQYQLCVDRGDGRQLGTLLMLAARSPRSLVYLPLRSSPDVPGVGRPEERPLDLDEMLEVIVERHGRRGPVGRGHESHWSQYSMWISRASPRMPSSEWSSVQKCG